MLCFIFTHGNFASAYDSERAALIAIHDVRVEFFGKASHASAAPWEGKLLTGIIHLSWRRVIDKLLFMDRCQCFGCYGTIVEQYQHDATTIDAH